MTKTMSQSSPEMRERAAQMVLVGAGLLESRWAVNVSISSKFGRL